MDHLWQDLRFAVRTLLQRRGFSVVAIGTLALGIGITTAIFSVVNGILLRPLPYRDSARIVSLWQTRTTKPTDRGSMSHVNFLDLRGDARSLESVALAAEGTSTLTGGGSASLVTSAIATPGLFHVFGADPVLGRDFTEEEDRPMAPRAVVIGHELWQERLGGASTVVGTTLELSGEPYTIVGVAPEGFDFPKGAQLWTPMRNDDARCGRGCQYTSAYGRLAAEASITSAQEELQVIGDRLAQAYPRTNAEVNFGVRTLQDSIVGDVRTAIYVLLGAVVMVLLIACANVANLMLVRGAQRQAELAVRTALGAGRGRIVSQLMTECLVLAAVAGTCGVLIASVGVDALRAIAPAAIPRTQDLGLDATAVLFALALVAVTALLFGLAPALQLSRASLGESVRASGRGTDGGARHFGRSAILTAEVALSIVLLTGAGLLMRSFVRLNAVDPGFDAADVTTFSIGLPAARYATPQAAADAFRTVRDEMAAIPGVESAAVMLGVPFGGIGLNSSFTRAELPPPDPAEEPGAALRVIDEKALATLRIPLVRGRDFTADDRQGAVPVALINEATAAKYFPGEDPIGKQIEIAVGLGFSNDAPRTIVGVAADVHDGNLRSAPAPALYTPVAQMGADFGSILLRSTRPSAEILAAARAVMQRIDADIPLEAAGTVQGLVDQQLATPWFYLALIGLFAALAATLSAVGIYGVVAYVVAHRTREIGVRMALGARGARVVGLVVWQGFKPAIAGVVIGIGGALAAVRVLDSLLYGVPARDVPTFVGVTALLVGVVLLACAIPAYRATRIPPAVALRNG
jgi:putative ABC transport system permease protein